MSKTVRCITDGTAALEPGYRPQHSRCNVEVHAFRGGMASASVRDERRHTSHGAHAVQKRSAFRKVLDASEMYCSLKFEDFRGCPYNLFSKADIATLSTASAVIATLAIALGM